MNESGLACAQFLGLETVQLQEAWPLVREEYIGLGQQLVKSARSSLESSKTVDRMPTCASQKNASSSESLGRQILRTSAP